MYFDLSLLIHCRVQIEMVPYFSPSESIIYQQDPEFSESSI